VATTGAVATLVDSNVIIDVLSADATWASWSERALKEARAAGALVINSVIYAEVGSRFSRREELDLALPPDRYLREHVPWPAAYLAGRAHTRYRRHGGAPTTPLPDFFIGAHAAVTGMRLLTRDAGHFATYFPRVELIAPA
jgi:predicted nucleic acid-binding protein